MSFDPATSDHPSSVRDGSSAVTLRDVADAAGVSTASVSRALDPTSPYVSAELRARVRDAAERLGYRPNASARATTTGSTAIVAVLVTDIRDPYNAETVHGVIEEAGCSGLMATFAGTAHAIDDEVSAVRMMRGLRPHAIILTGTHRGSEVSARTLLEELEHFTRDGGRVVVAGADDLPFDTAVVPRRRGARELVEALFRLGYRSPALIGPDIDTAATLEWEEGVMEATHGLGMPIESRMRLRAPMTRDGGYEATLSLMELRPAWPDVVLAATDAMAIGAMSAMRDGGAIPGVEIGVAGFGNVVGADDVTPGLTSVDLAIAKAGASAVELALMKPAAERRIVEFEPHVVLRGTTPGRAR